MSMQTDRHMWCAYMADRHETLSLGGGSSLGALQKFTPMSPFNTKSPGPRPCSIPSDILIHAAIWPQHIWAEKYSASILGQTNNHSNILSYCMISTAISSNLINNCSFKLQFNHIKFYHLESFYCSLHCGRQPRSRHMQKLHLTKSGGLRSCKALDFKKWGARA